MIPAIFILYYLPNDLTSKIEKKLLSGSAEANHSAIIVLENVHESWIDSSNQYEISTLCYLNVGPESAMLAEHYTNIGRMPCFAGLRSEAAFDFHERVVCIAVSQSVRLGPESGMTGVDVDAGIVRAPGTARVDIVETKLNFPVSDRFKHDFLVALLLLCGRVHPSWCRRRHFTRSRSIVWHKSGIATTKIHIIDRE